MYFQLSVLQQLVFYKKYPEVLKKLFFLFFFFPLLRVLDKIQINSK